APGSAPDLKHRPAGLLSEVAVEVHVAVDRAACNEAFCPDVVDLGAQAVSLVERPRLRVHGGTCCLPIGLTCAAPLPLLGNRLRRPRSAGHNPLSRRIRNARPTVPRLRVPAAYT